MANTQTFGVADPNRVLAGQVLQTSPDEIAAAAGMHNWLLGEYGCTAVVSQGWPDGAFSHDGAKALGPTFQVPALSDRHDLVSVVITYTAVGAAPAVVFTVSSVSGGDTQSSAALGAGGPVEVTIADLTIDTTGDFDDVQIEVESTVGQTVTVHDVRIVPVPLASPLPAESVGGAAPQGVGRAGADMSHTARLNFDLVEALPILRARPRVLWQWSGLGAIGPSTLQENTIHRSTVRTWPGAQRSGTTYTARAYVTNASGAAQRLYWQVGDPAQGLNGAHVVDVANGFSGYKTTTFTIREGMYLPGYPYEAAALRLKIDTSAPGRGASGVNVLRFAVMGE